MKKMLQRLGKSFMQPVAVMPLAALLLGIGYMIDPVSWGGGSPLAAFLIKAGAAVLDNLGFIFAVGIAFGLSKDNHGAAAMAGLVAFLTITTLLSTGAVAQYKSLAIDAWKETNAFEVAAFDAINSKNAFTGILSGILGAYAYNKFHQVKLPDFLAFFSGRRLVPIMASVLALLASGLLYFVWPVVYVALVNVGQTFQAMGPVGAGLYAMINRLLIPTGLHHAVNQVFWFNLVGINDIPNFLNNNVAAITSTYHPGMYQAGFFPIMMFGLPAAALAMYSTAKKEKKSLAKSLLLAAALASFTTGVTEPIEFAFMFLAPGLYAIHAVLTGISVFLASQLGWYAGFGFSAGLFDMILSANNPMAQNWFMLIPLGLVFALIYFVVFRWAILHFHLKTPGREDDDVETMAQTGSSDDRYDHQASIILEGLGGKENIAVLDNCITRLRIEVNDEQKVNEDKIKSAQVAGILKTGHNSLQVIIGPQVQAVRDAMDKLL